MSEVSDKFLDVIRDPRSILQYLGEYFSLKRFRKTPPINDLESLQTFLDTRACYVSQTSLYGYLRTRAGMRYPELFDDDAFVVSINIAKWYLWLACLSDLAVYAGGMLMQHPGAEHETVHRLINQAVDEILQKNGCPQEAGDQFAEQAGHVRQRLAMCRWDDFSDGEQVFTHSPQALFESAPVVDDLKQLDEEIVVNSVRFRWQQVRADWRKAADAEALLASPG